MKVLINGVYYVPVNNKINKHQGHEATCLCCRYLEIDGEGSTTDGPPDNIHCTVDLLPDGRLYVYEHHKLIFGRTCAGFKAKEYGDI